MQTQQPIEISENPDGTVRVTMNIGIGQLESIVYALASVKLREGTGTALNRTITLNQVVDAIRESPINSVRNIL